MIYSLQFNMTSRALTGDGLNELTQSYFAWLAAIEEKVGGLISRFVLLHSRSLSQLVQHLLDNIAVCQVAFAPVRLAHNC